MRCRTYFVLLAMTVTVLVLAPSFTVGQFKGKKGVGGGIPGLEGGDFGPAADVFSRLAKGRGYFLVSESPRRRDLGLDLFLEARGITDGKVTRELFLAFNAQPNSPQAGLQGARNTFNDQGLDALGPAFLEAYERARTLRKVLEEAKTPDGKGTDKAVEALDLFLKRGKEFVQAAKQRVKEQAVEDVKREIEHAVAKVEKTTHDRWVAIDTLDEIERLVKAMKTKLKSSLPKDTAFSP